jgi:pyruvate,water dikinase
MEPFVLPLENSELSVANAGGKAATLSCLLRAGFRVPKGFVVVTDAYAHFVATNRLAPIIAAIWDRVDPADLKTFDAASTQIRSLFQEGSVPKEISNEIRAFYNERVPMDRTVAVRSSATAEDRTDASFAGQQDSYLNIIGEGALLDAVVRCWSSLWTARAIAYRMQRGIRPEDVRMAVLVQIMVPATMSGVLFTVNPMNGDPDQMVINATWGLGSILVGGEITPDMYIADRGSGDLLESKLADKRVMVAINDGHMEEVDVDVSQRIKSSLSPLHVSALVALGRQLEKALGAPQDIEWSIAQGRVYILQSRPITTRSGFLSYRATGDDAWPPLPFTEPRPYDLWTQADLGERWPEPITPLTWSTWQPITEASMIYSFKGLNAPFLRQIEWVRRAYGRAYLNEGALAYVLHQGYGMPATSFAEGLGSAPDLVKQYENWRWWTLIRRIPLILAQVRSWEKQIVQFERDFPKIERWVDQFMERDLSTPSDADLWAEAQGLWQERIEIYIRYHTAVTSTSMNAYSQMEGLLRRWAGDGALLQPLVAGLSGVIQAEIVPALWEIARKVQSQGLSPILLSHSPQDALHQLLHRKDAEPIQALLARFLQRHGHRSTIEAEWLHPRWIDDPAQVIEQVASYLRAGPEVNLSPPDQGQADRLKATQTVNKRLNWWQRLYFGWGLRRLQRLVRMRDNGQHYLVKLALPQRRLYATLAQRWADRGWLEQPDDFFFLVTGEIEATLVASDSARADLKEKSQARRTAWEYWMSRPDFPPVLGADGKPLPAPEPGAEDEHTLVGIGASPGRVEGIARVILSPKDATKLQRGEILVTRSTDPGWTPVFSLIGGVVMEIGGQLSHGAIVAREYGLPAVINVNRATRKIQDGQRIILDGTAGRVYLK